MKPFWIVDLVWLSLVYFSCDTDSNKPQLDEGHQTGILSTIKHIVEVWIYLENQQTWCFLKASLA